MKSQRLARIATVALDGQPDVAPVGFEFDGQYFYVGGRNPSNTRKFRNLRRGNHKIALVIDDLEAVQPWELRGIRIYGTAEVVERDGQFGHSIYMRFIPHTSWSWGLEPGEMVSGRPGHHKTVHQSRLLLSEATWI